MPTNVVRENTWNPTARPTAMAINTSSVMETLPPNTVTIVSGNTPSTGRGWLPQISSTLPCMITDHPTVVTNSPCTDVPAIGRTAMRSSRTPITAPQKPPMKIATTGLRPSVVDTQNARNVPNIRYCGCAKLKLPEATNTILKPTATIT